jgi:uncharacterized protein YegP (UPF0339 family)
MVDGKPLADFVTRKQRSADKYYYIYKDTAGYWRWTLYASNYRKIADSGEGYFNKADAEHGINLVKSSIAAPVRQASAA